MKRKWMIIKGRELIPTLSINISFNSIMFDVSFPVVPEIVPKIKHLQAMADTMTLWHCGSGSSQELPEQNLHSIHENQTKVFFFFFFRTGPSDIDTASPACGHTRTHAHARAVLITRCIATAT